MDIGRSKINPEILVIIVSLIYILSILPMACVGFKIYFPQMEIPVFYLGLFLAVVQALLIFREALSQRRL